MPDGVPHGFQVAAVHCGLKRDPRKEDLALAVADRAAVAAGVYTQNRVQAAPVILDRSRTPSDSIRAVVCNSGNANACTGQRGLEDARRMAQLAAEAVGCDEQQVLVLSTGIIGEYLPMEKIATGIRTAQARLGRDDEALRALSRGILTTDAFPKTARRDVDLDGRSVQLVGVAKGAGMIGPRMATMLALLLTDAPLEPDTAQQVLSAAVDDSFNCISVDGHTSTNDSVLLLASGAGGGKPLSGAHLQRFGQALTELCVELAKMIPSDGEGASHLITIDVVGCKSRADAHAIARTVADSPLVKTAVAGGDPNWGRIVSAVGYAGVPFDLDGLGLKVNGTPLFERGAPVPFDAAAVSRSIREHRDTHLELSLTDGSARVRFWTSDLNSEYVRFNSDYRT